MNILINYFSQTNMTATIAQEIAKAFTAQGHSCQAKPFTEVSREELVAADMIGCGAPVHMWQIPDNYQRFMTNLPDLKGKYGFVFVTYGDVITGNTLFDMARLLKNKGAIVLGGYKSVGYHSMPPMRKAGKGKGHPNAEELRLARTFAERLYAKITDKPLDITERLDLKRPIINLMKKFMSKKAVNLMMPPIKVKADKCNHCGLCLKLCPEANITMDAAPRFIGDCLKCYQCVANCPSEALQVNWLPLNYSLPLLDALKEPGESLII